MVFNFMWLSFHEKKDVWAESSFNRRKYDQTMVFYYFNLMNFIIIIYIYYFL